MIVLLVDGHSEYSTLVPFVRKYPGWAKVPMRIARINGHAGVPRPQLAREIYNKGRVVTSTVDATRIVVAIDREAVSTCPGALASDLKAEIRRQDRAGLLTNVPLEIVIKNRTYENWLIADPDGLDVLQGRFRLSRRIVDQVRTSGADGIDAYRILRRAAQLNAYDKVEDAVRITKVSRPSRAAKHSRSFRKFLRSIGVDDPG